MDYHQTIYIIEMELEFIQIPFDFIGQNLSELPPLDPELKILYCSDNNLTQLPPLPATLKLLNCARNTLQTLPELPEGLETLECSNNNFTVLPPLPKSLLKFTCDGYTYGGTRGYRNIKLQHLPTFPSTLTYLRCCANDITELPTQLPQELQYLYCNDNKLTSLLELPQSLKILSCYYNQLTSLPELPQSLKKIDCDRNNLHTLPALPQGLQHLNCSNNPLTVLPELPPKLQELIIHNVPLVTLPELPKTLNRLILRNTNLIELPDLPESLNNIDICYDPTQFTHPPLKSLYPFLDAIGIHYTNTPEIMRLVNEVNETQRRNRQQQRTALIKSDVMRLYAERTMNPMNLQPLLDDPDKDVDGFMNDYIDQL